MEAGAAEVRGDKGGKGRGKYSADIMGGVWDACNMIKDGARKRGAGPATGSRQHPPRPRPRPRPRSPEPEEEDRRRLQGHAKAKKLSEKEEKAIAKAEEEAVWPRRLPGSNGPLTRSLTFPSPTRLPRRRPI